MIHLIMKYKVNYFIFHDWKEVTNLIVRRTALERPTKGGDSPVSENDQTFVLFPEYPWSRLSVVNLGLLRSKAKYF